jgi:membrane-bound lytic murein transglycosylase A
MLRGAFAGLASALLLAGCAAQPTKTEAPAEPVVALQAVEFSDLAGWAGDDPAAALQAFRTSCRAMLKREPGARMGRAAWAGRVLDWQPACTAAASIGPGAETARLFFESSFVPFAVTSDGEPSGLFTGYYEPLLNGSLRAGGRYTVPLHARPADLVSVDLGQFAPELEGKRIAGRVAKGRLVPYPTRAEIDGGALAGRDIELLWVDDPVAKFFLQIQGSGLVDLDDGRRLRVGFADQNGREYRAIGRDLVAMGALSKDEVSLQTIRDWMKAHPDQAPALMAKNPSYVFFREVGDAATTSGPLGAQGVALTPERSLAVDRRYMPLGVPVWLDTTAPMPEGEQPLRRLMIAQDTGGAIQGPIRGDVFWGSGARAEFVAGHMKSQGRWYVLLPRTLVPSA